MFINQSHKDLFQRQGFIVLPLLETTDIEYINKIYKDSASSVWVEHPFYASTWSPNLSYRKLIYEKVSGLLSIYVSKYIIDSEPIFSNLHVKKEGFDSSLLPHQDWNFVNEPDHESITIWCPLTDTNEANGALQVIPGSHRINNYIRGRFFDAPFKDLRDTAIKEKLVSIPVKAGEAIFFHSRLIHASSSNFSKETRVAASVVMIPKGTPIIHDVLNLKTSMVKRLNVTPAFFYNYSCFDDLHDLSSENEYPYHYKSISAEELYLLTL